MDGLDLDPGFEPQTRARSNTWPLPRPENFVEPDGAQGGQCPDTGAPKKNSSRRNAWGNMSYADLITQAIQSSPDKRLTLAQIYEWMVQNVAYFKDKGDSNSSAGWKNSIRHNLSLHNRFMRVQNEGTGKSSWWMINPDAKPGKAARRRATSMETHKYEKKRGRVKKKVEALRNGATPSPSSSLSEGQDLFPESPVQHGFQLSPDFRPRASSNASSCGRLSPIPAVESDMGDGDMPPLSPLPWCRLYEQNGSSHNPSPNVGIERFNTDHLVKSLAESMKLRNPNGEPDYRLPDCALKPLTNGRQPPQQMPNAGYTCISYNPPHYNNGGPNGSTFPGTDLPTKRRNSPPQQVIETLNGRSYNTLTRLQSVGQIDYLRQQRTSYLGEVDLRPPIAYKEIKEEKVSPVLSSCTEATTPAPPYPHHHTLMGSNRVITNNHQTSSTSLVNTASHVVGHLLYNSLPQDLDFEPLSGGLECDVDQVIRHELSVDGNLDFNFDSSSASATAATPGGSSAQHHPSAIASTRSWVH